MLVARRVPVPVGLVRFTDRADSYSIAVKMTFDIAHAGWATRLADADPLSADVLDEQESRRYPSDFVPMKLTCDVLLVGEALGDQETPARVRASGLSKSASCAALLGPLPADRTDPLAQDAPLDQRLPWPQLPLEVGVDYGGVNLGAILPGPMPSAALVFDGQVQSAIAQPLHIDTILLDPVEATCSVIFRGLFQHPGSVHRSLLFVVDPNKSLASVPIEEVEAWPRVPVEMAPDAMVDATYGVGAPEAPVLDLGDADDQDEEAGPDSDTAVRPIPRTAPPPAPVQAEPEAEPGPPSLRAAGLPFLPKLDSPHALEDDEGPRSSSRTPLLVIGPIGTPLAYPPVPFKTSPRSEDPEDTLPGVTPAAPPRDR